MTFMLRYGLTQSVLRDYVKLQKLGILPSRVISSSATLRAPPAAAAEGVSPDTPVPEGVKGLDKIFTEFGTAYWGTIPMEPPPRDLKEFPERDVVNFPHPDLPLYPLGKTRFNVIPDTWFNAFYEKTGVTGPYFLFFTGWNFILSKEIIVWEEHMANFPVICGLLYAIHRMLGHKAQKQAILYCHEELVSDEAWRKKAQDGLKACIADEETHQAALKETTPLLAAAAKEHIQLQQEKEYRSRVANVHGEVKRRLDFIVESEETKTRFEHKHMVTWVADQVRASITPDKEKAFLNQCVLDLQNLAKTSK